jgi:general secretion pathway protein K
MFTPDALPVARAEQLIAQAPPGGYAEWPAALGPELGLGMGEITRSDRWLRARLEATIDRRRGRKSC